MGRTAKRPVQLKFRRQEGEREEVGWRGGQSAMEALEFCSQAGFMPWLSHLQLCDFGQSI